MNSNIPPTPPAHIFAKCDTIFQDLVIQQRNLDKIFADGWPTLNCLAGHTPKPGRSHSFVAPPPRLWLPPEFCGCRCAIAANAATDALPTLPLAAITVP
jgi:hypothetical protein